MEQDNILNKNGKSFLEPELIVRYFGLEKGDYVADFGAGHGYFTIPMARAVGGDGKVYALDIQKSVFDIIRDRAKLEHLLNIEFIWTDIDFLKGSKLKDKFVDFVLIANTLFQSEHQETVLQEAYRVLREKGRMAIIEWVELSDLGPVKNSRVKKEKARKFAENSGFEFDREFSAGNYHYGLLFIKK